MLSFLHPLSLSLTVRRRRRMKMSILADAYSHSLAFTGRRRRRRVRRNKFSRFLPEEIMENIFTRLPVKSIIRFRCVSKYWLHQFQNPNFIKNHLNHAIRINRFNILLTNVNYRNVLLSTSSPFLSRALDIDYPFRGQKCVPEIHGSSHGLVCISGDNYCIWNPATREYKLVPESLADPKSVYSIAHGFGFDCKNDDYKLLKIARFEGNATVSEARLYSLASNSWKNLGFIPFYIPFAITNGFLLNGVLHWVASTDLRTEPKSDVILCFDLSDETFCDVPLPPYSNSNLYLSYLGVWEGKLCLLHQNYMEEDPDICTHQNDHIDVWTMVDNKWSKHSKITAHMREIFYRRPIQTLQNGEVLFEGIPGMDACVDLISYDPKLERARAIKIHGFPDSIDDTIVETYIETLVALNSGTYVGQ